MKAIVVPQFGETILEEMTILSWEKSVGDLVNAGDLLFEVETDKAVMQVEAFESGTLIEIIKQAGESARAGDTVGYLDDGQNESQSNHD